MTGFSGTWTDGRTLRTGCSAGGRPDLDVEWTRDTPAAMRGRFRSQNLPAGEGYGAGFSGSS
jgi:hypothetical protein